MVGKKLISVAAAVCMGATMLSGLCVNAAEKSLAPWSVYFAQKDEFEDYSKFLPAELTFNNGKASLPPAGEVLLSNRADGYTTAKAAADAKGYQGKYGSAAIGFTAPEAGSYEIYFYADNNISGGGNHDKGMSKMTFGTVDKAENKVGAFDEVSIDGYNSSGNKQTEYTKTVELAKGEELLAKLATSFDGYLRSLNLKYQIKDLTSGALYDYNNVGDVVVPTAKSEKNTWNPSDYRTLKDKDNSMWSIYLTTDVGGEAWKDFSTWKAYPIEDNRNASTNGVSIQSGTTQLGIYDSRPNGWFYWRPAGDHESNGTGTAVIGWTAPAAGTYVFEVSGFNYGTDVKSGESTAHKMAYKAADSNEMTELNTFTIPGAAKNTQGDFKAQYTVAEGETIYLLNDPGYDGWGDSVDLRFVVTDASNPANRWSASDMYKQEIENSPFKYWYSKHGETSLSRYYAANLFQSGDGIKTTNTTAEIPNLFEIKSDGSFYARPEADGTIGGNLGLTFDVPEDGFYRVDFDAQNVNPEGGEESWYETSRAILYHLTGRTAVVGDELENTGRIKKSEKSEFSHLISAKRGDKILLNINADNNSWKIYLKGHYNITKLDKFNYSYTQDGSKITAASELTAGAALTANLDFLADSEQSITLVTAVYNQNGTMTAVGVSEPVTAAAGAVTPVSASLTVPELTGGEYVRTFVVDGINTLVPLNAADELK